MDKQSETLLTWLKDQVFDITSADGEKISAKDLASAFLKETAAVYGEELFTLPEDQSLIYANGKINEISTEEIAYNLSKDDDKLVSLSELAVFDVISNKETAEFLTEELGEELTAEVMDELRIQTYQLLLASETNGDLHVMYSSADGDNAWLSGVVKEMLASDSVKTINGIEKQAIVEMYSSKTEIFGYSEEEALKVIGQYISFANYDLLHDASVAADENGDFIIDENGHLDINFDRDVLSSDTNAVQPFFPKVTEDSIVDDIKEFVVGDQQIINAVEELETINGDNGYSELYSSMNDKAALDEEIVRFAVEYAEEIDNSSSEFLRSVKNAAEQSGLSTTYVQERIAEVNKENNITTSKNTTTLFNDDFAKKYPILSRTYNNVTRPTTTTTTTTTVPSLSTGGTNPSASSQGSADSEKPETFSDQLEKLDNGLIYVTDIAGHVSDNTGRAMQIEGSAWGKGGNAAGLISDGKAYSNATWALIGVSGAISTYKAYKTYQETGDVGAATKVMTNWALSTSCSVLLEEGFMAFAGPSLVALTAACPPAGIILTIASAFLVAKAGSEIGSALNDLLWDIGDWLGSHWGSASRAHYVDPLILDLDKNGFDIETRKNGTHFDLNTDGFAEKINWTNTDGILAVDLNKNGTIDDGGEVFGDYHLLADGTRAKNGFEALAQYDANGDDVIDEKDAIFKDLRIWVDVDNSGASEKGELKTLSEMGIKSIHLDYAASDINTETEALIGNTAKFEYKDGTEGDIGELWVASDLFDAVEHFVSNVSDEVNGLPDVRSYGTVRSLHSAIAADETGTLKGLVEKFTTETDIAERKAIVGRILENICGADNIEDNSRGSNFSAKKLTVVEKFMGEEFNGASGRNPNGLAAPILENMYQQIVDMYTFSMLGSSTTKYAELLFVTKTENGYNINTELFNIYMSAMIKTEQLTKEEFADAISYISYISSNALEDYRVVYDIRSYFADSIPEYADVIDNVVFDAARGTADDDELKGTAGADVIFGDDGDDTIDGGNGNDLIFGGDNNDTLSGGNGNDIVDGGSGDDILYGNSGNDTLAGGKGNDTLYGGYGDDTYIFNLGDGQDTINEENIGSKADRIVFGEGITAKDIKVTRDGNDMVLLVGSKGDSIRLVRQYTNSGYQV
ncbi:MAG: hypothetical protein K6B38_01415, partial [Ruminococcus sp.]|nr:hypothetical protein [Ruminococcus sp.]